MNTLPSKNTNAINHLNHGETNRTKIPVMHLHEYEKETRYIQRLRETKNRKTDAPKKKKVDVGKEKNSGNRGKNSRKRGGKLTR